MTRKDTLLRDLERYFPSNNIDIEGNTLIVNNKSIRFSFVYLDLLNEDKNSDKLWKISSLLERRILQNIKVI